MLSVPDTYPIDIPPLKSELKMPYTLTPGRATGTFLAEIARRRIVGTRFTSGVTVVPAQDFCPMSGASDYEFVLAPETGVLTGYTETSSGLLGLIRIDGTDVDFPHRIVGAGYADLRVGMCVRAVWAEDAARGILAIAGFGPAVDAAVAQPTRLDNGAPSVEVPGKLTRLDNGAPSVEVLGKLTRLENSAPPVEVVPYELSLHYEHAFGPYYGRLFDEIKTNRRIMGVRSPTGDGAMVPPREICDITHKPTGTWVEVGQTGTVRAMSIIYLEFLGQKQPPPYIYAEIMLDGASTRLIHNVAGIDMSKAKELVKPGTRVRAVWRETRTGSLDDISHFEVIDESKVE